ncbi:hypothetical protein B447_10628 [Thauera sp. 27]|uniref:hypothetical protein n=1 Tax=Thauera sp. 27 TaxID=305700 RepID=UPI0002CD8FFB|nr:hypothetical protein [Thauera sp. 27]ENO80915.1 hypothetical protein B447_10628 [Thauera sp. 27]
MNARDNTPLRTLIADYLAAGEDTAAGIAKAIGKGDTPSMVIKELNAMRTDGQVECEQRGKKKELVYWLAVPLAVAADDYEPEPPPAPATISEVMLPPGVRHGTRAAQIYRVLPLYGAEPIDARAIATATGCAKALIESALWAMVKAGQCMRHSTGGPYGYTRLPPASPETVPQNVNPEAADEMPPADASLLALANRELSDRLARVAHVLRGSGLEGLKDLDDGADLQSAAAALTGAYQMALADLQARTDSLSAACSALGAIGDRLDVDSGTGGCGPILDAIDLKDEEVADLQHKINMQDAELFKQAGVVVDLRNQLGAERTARQALQEQIDELQREAMRGASLLSGDDRYTAAGYLVRAPKRPLRTFSRAESAQAAALAAARNGSGRGEVFALVPVGKAVRGAEWRPS